MIFEELRIRGVVVRPEFGTVLSIEFQRIPGNVVLLTAMSAA